jgi:ribose transport system ATP-binding protein
VAENLFVDGFPRRPGLLRPFIDRAAMRARAQGLLARVGLDVPPDRTLDALAPGERQLVEIARALHHDASLIIFDEPTTSLTARETERLFEVIEGLRAAGRSASTYPTSWATCAASRTGSPCCATDAWWARGPERSSDIPR